MRQVGTRRALVLLRDLDILACQCNRQALGIEPRGGDKALLRQLLGRGATRSSACKATFALLARATDGLADIVPIDFAGGTVVHINAGVSALVGAIFSLWITGTTLSIIVFIGLIMLVGIVVYACFEAALHHRCHFDLHRPGCKCPGQQRGQRQRRSAAVCHGFLVHCGCFSSCRFQSLRGRVIRAF